MNNKNNSIQIKNAFFFSHDSNARNDEKIVRLRMHHGAEGYGIYFMLVELVMESTDYQLSTDYAALAFQLHVDKERLRSIVEDFNLFQFSEDGTTFFSASLHKRIAPLEDIREQRRQAGIRSGEARRAKKEAKEAEAIQAVENEQTSNTCSVFVAPNRTEKSREKESKEKKNRVEESNGETTFAKVESPSIPQGGSAHTNVNNLSFNKSSKKGLNIANAVSISSYKQNTEVQTLMNEGAGAARQSVGECSVSSALVVEPEYKRLSFDAPPPKVSKTKDYTYF